MELIKDPIPVLFPVEVQNLVGHCFSLIGYCRFTFNLIGCGLGFNFGILHFANKGVNKMSRNETYDEKELLERVARGDEEAFERVFHNWRDKLYFFTLKFTQSPQQSEDLVQDVFIKLWMNRERLTEISNLGAWLYSIIRNEAISGLRRIALETTILSELKKGAVTSGEPVEEALFRKQLQQKINEAIEQLPLRQKQVYTLTRIDGKKQEEVADMLGISLSTVQNHMTEALRKLKLILMKDYPAVTVSLLWISLLSFK